ncbi:CCHC-type domain-containing protein [Trichonephila clavipes]|nr:CCHC-type domain-containing protein [Trichonephila clavipes]
MLTPNIQPLEDSVLPVCSYHLIGSCLRNSAHHQPPGRNTKPTKYQIEDGGIRPNPVSLYMANIRLTSCSSCEKCWMQVSPVPASDEVCPPQKTRQRIKYSFYWPTIKQDVKRFCESRKICQLRKPITYRDRVPIQPLVRPEIPFEVWSVDCIGPLKPPSRRNHHFILPAVPQKFDSDQWARKQIKNLASKF